MSNDLAGLLKRMDELEKALNNTVRFGRVERDDKGQMVAYFGKNQDGKPIKSPLTRKAQQNGFVTENTPWAEGQAVCIIAMDPDGQNTVALSMGENDFHPADKNASNDKITRRRRKLKKREQKDEQGKSGEAPSSFTDKDVPEPEKQKDDDENDWIEEETQSSRKVKIGKMERSYGRDENGKEFITEKIDKLSFKRTAEGLELEIDGTKFMFTKAGFEQEGGKLKHDGMNIGATHVHDGVMKGGAKTGQAQPDE